MDELRERDVLYGILAFLAFGVIAAGYVIAFVFYLLTLQNTLKIISPENRKMPPANVWLMFIPVFNIVWAFFVVDAIGNSLNQEYEKYGIFHDAKPTYGIGLAMAILPCCTIIPVVGLLAWLGGVVCWLVYWVRVSACKNEIANIRSSLSSLEGDKSIFL